MDFERLIGQTFFENEFYELLLFEIEQNFEQHSNKFLHFYFERTPVKKIRITEVFSFNNSEEMDKTARSIIEQKEWFEIDQNQIHINLYLVRFDRTGFVSSIQKNSTHTQEWKMGWADEKPWLGRPLTPEEMRKGFQELAGIFEDQIVKQKLELKKAI